MPPNLTDDLLPRRNARSFDLEEAGAKAKAAAWVWHLHESKPDVTEGRFLSLQARRRSSSCSSDRKTSRFRHEAVTDSAALKPDAAMWDCGSSLYDTFELVAFGNWLDRRMIKTVTFTPSTPPPPPPPPASREPHEAAACYKPTQIPRTRSIPMQKKHAVTEGLRTDMNGDCVANAIMASSEAEDQTSSKRWWSVNRLSKALKKLGDMHRQVSVNAGCRQNVDIVQPSRTRSWELQAKVPTDWTSSSRQDYRREDPWRLSEGRKAFQSTESKSLRYAALLTRAHGSNYISADGSIVPNTGKLEHKISPQNSHSHLHHHHHYHHHHYLHHTLSQSARSGAEIDGNCLANQRPLKHSS